MVFVSSIFFLAFWVAPSFILGRFVLRSLRQLEQEQTARFDRLEEVCKRANSQSSRLV